MQPSNGTAFYRKQEQDPKVADVLIAAAEFATFAIERVIRQMAGDEEGLSRLAGRYVDLVYGLEIHFAFLNLGERERDRLVALRKARNAISVEQNGFRQWRNPTQYRQHKLIIESLKAQFVRLRAEIENSALRTRLTPLQKKILDQEYLSIPVAEGGSTTMFFNRSAGLEPAPANSDPTSPGPANANPAEAGARPAAETQPALDPALPGPGAHHRKRRRPISGLVRGWNPDEPQHRI